MKRVFKSLAIGVVFLTIFSNIPPFRYILAYVIDYNHNRYSNASGTFTRIDKGDHLKGVKIGFERFLGENRIESRDTILYRTFWRNPLTFWRYWDYTHEKYKLPYKKWKEIDATREKNRKLYPEADTLRSYQRF